MLMSCCCAQVAPPAPAMRSAMPAPSPPRPDTWAPTAGRAAIPSATDSVYSEDFFSSNSAAVDRTAAPHEASSVAEDDSLHIAANSIPSSADISGHADALVGGAPLLLGVHQELALSVSEEASRTSSRRVSSGCDDGDVQDEPGVRLRTSNTLDKTVTVDDIPFSPTSEGASHAARSPASAGPASEASCSVEDLAAAESNSFSDEEQERAEVQSEGGGSQYSSGTAPLCVVACL
jgi:hypothetical protein